MPQAFFYITSDDRNRAFEFVVRMHLTQGTKALDVIVDLIDLDATFQPWKFYSVDIWGKYLVNETNIPRVKRTDQVSPTTNVKLSRYK